MAETYERLLVGGPLDGHTVTIDRQVDAIDIGAEHDGMYHRIHQPASERHGDGNFEINLEWTYFEWHERDWISPPVRAIWDAVLHAATR